MKKLMLLILGLVTLIQTAFATNIEEWQDNKGYPQYSRVTYKGLYYKAALWANAGVKPTDGSPWEEIDAPSPYPIIAADYTYYICKFNKSITDNMTPEITDGDSPYTLVIVKEPTQGTATVSGALFTYTPNKSLEDIKEFTDSFEIKVKDSKGYESKNSAEILIKLDSKWESEQYYESRIESDINSISMQNDPNCWFEYFKDRIHSDKGLDALKYYVRVRGANECDLSKISEDINNPNNPENVKRVIRLMPKENFEKMFPMSKNMTEVNGFVPGKVYNYLNFLKAVAVMPGYCGDYKNDSSPYIQEQLEKDPQFADKTAKKFLATTLAHAVQETTNEGDSTTGAWKTTDSGFKSKVHGTFGHVREQGAENSKYPDTAGPFAKSGNLNYLTFGNNYYGRGAKQLSYPANYANTSLLLYGDLRLVKFPNLVEKDILPFLTAITYTLIPKSSNPSIAEVMDGSWSDKWNASQAPQQEKVIYARDFPLTVLIVNGGPECNGHTDDTSVANSKTRIDGYNYFSKSNDLLNPEITYEVEEGPDYYKVDKLQSDYINNAKTDYQKLFRRYYYYDNGSICEYDTGIQIFGGRAVDDNLKVISHPAKESDTLNKTHKSFL